MLPVDTEDQIIHGRPYKEGYLKKQINSIFDIWNTRYFYLDNTNFAYFDDEHTDKPSQIINLENCIVDGVWRNGELYTFTIRSLTDDETFLYVGAFSGAEADEWIRNLRAAVKLLEVDKIAEEMRDHGLNMPEIRNFIDKEDRFAEFEDRKSAETESDRDLDKGANEEMDWLTYLKMPNKEKIVDMPPQLDTAYHEFKRLLKNTSMYYTVLKSENYVNVCVHEYDPQYWIYKTSFFINGDFYNLVKVLNSDSNERFWNPYLAEIKQTRKLAENIQVFNSEYELELKNFIFTFQSFYINQAWIDRSKFNLIRSNLGASGRNYANNILSFDLPLELFGLRVSQVKCSYPKCKMTIIIKLKKRNFFLDNLFRRFIKKYMIAFTILRDELEELAEKVEVNKPPVTITEKEKDQTKLASSRSEKPASKASQQTVPEGRKLSFQQVVQQTVQQTNYGPSILELKTPEQKKALEELKKKLSAQGINMSDELTRRFLISKECVVADAETNIKKYQEWLQEMKFEEYDWQDPHMFSVFHQARFIKHVGFDREGRPIAFFRLKSFFPDKLPEEGFKKFMFSFIRWLCQQVKPGAEQYSLIADATDISRSNISLSLFTVCLKNLIAFFPQYVHKMYIVNGGFVVTMLYNTMKPLLKERHRKRLVFCNTSGNEAYKFLKMEMDDDIIPVHLGGKYMDY